jgi:hypothetical protein
MTPKTAASVAVLAMVMGLGSPAIAQTTPTTPNEGPAAAEHKLPPAGQMPPEKMPAEKVMPSPRSDAATGGHVTVQAADTVLGSDLIGRTLYGPDQKKIGNINDIVMKQDGSGVDGLVVGIGGFLGLGERTVALTMDKFSFRPTESGRMVAVLNATKEELDKAPVFKSKADEAAETVRNAPRPEASGPGAPSR